MDMKAMASKDDLQSFTRSLNTEICRVWEHWNVLKGINASYDEYFLEMNESGQFWRIATRAIQDVIIVRLGALVDPGDEVVSIPNFLRLLEQQMDQKTSVIDAKQQSNLSCANIDNDIDSVDKDAPVIKKVRRLRNKIVAHRDMSIVVREATHELPELPDSEIEGLITISTT